MTTNTSYVSLPSSAANEALSFSGCKTLMSLACAQHLTGEGVMTSPRPFAVSGVVTTSVGISPRSSRSSRKTAANAGVPKKTKLMLFFFIGFVIYVCGFVGIEDAFEVVHFMLEDVR